MRMEQTNIDMNNSAFTDAPGVELARILRQTADRIDEGQRGGGFFVDANGNTVGKWEIVED